MTTHSAGEQNVIFAAAPRSYASHGLAHGLLDTHVRNFGASKHLISRFRGRAPWRLNHASSPYNANGTSYILCIVGSIDVSAQC